MTFAGFMDIAILVLLAATVYIGFKLMMSLRNLHEARSEMEGLLNRLTSNIDRAENAIGGLQNAAKNSGVSLQSIINEAKFLADELKFMNEAGNGLANRLEKLAEKNRELVSKIETAGGAGVQEIRFKAMPQQFKTQEQIDIEEFERELALLDAEDVGIDSDDTLVLDMPPLQSQAERELYEALARKGKLA
jgi:chromosome segregation ATPase